MSNEHDAKVARPAPATGGGKKSPLVQLKQAVAAMPYGEQVEAIRPAMPLQFHHDTVQAAAVQMTPPATPPSGSTDVALADAQRELATAASGDNTYTAAEAAAVANEIAASGRVPQSALDAAKRDAETRLVTAWQRQIGSAKTFCQQYAAPDAIATRKFGELDAEPDTNYESGSAATHRDPFYTQLAGKIVSGGRPTRRNTFGACDRAVRDAGQPMKGKRIPQTMLEPLLHRTTGIHGTLKYTTDNDAVGAAFQADRVCTPALRALRPREVVRNHTAAVAAWWTGKGGAYVKSTLVNPLTPPGGGTWFSSGQVTVSTTGDAGFRELMEIGALQPEWFAEGALKLTIDSSRLPATPDNICKPTCLDGMQSGLFVPRPDPGYFGVTGGGFNEFLAASVPPTSVRSVEIFGTSGSLEASIRAADQQARAAGHGNAMDAMERGETLTTDWATSTYDQVGTSTARERRSPTAVDSRGQR